jgi:arsenate reductase
MAEGLLRNLYGEKYEVFSAGTEPTRVHPLAIKVMAEIGIDISGQRSKSMDEFSDADIDLAVSVCQSSAKTVCALCSRPILEGRPEIVKEKLHKTKNYIVHGFSDPSEIEASEEERLAAFRRVRDEIREWIIEEFTDLRLGT